MSGFSIISPNITYMRFIYMAAWPIHPQWWILFHWVNITNSTRSTVDGYLRGFLILATAKLLHCCDHSYKYMYTFDECVCLSVVYILRNGNAEIWIMQMLKFSELCVFWQEVYKNSSHSTPSLQTLLHTHTCLCMHVSLCQDFDQDSTESIDQFWGTDVSIFHLSNYEHGVFSHLFRSL